MAKLTILVGRSGVGKTEQILQEIAREKEKSRHIILSPEQLSHKVERKLCQIAGNSISLYSEVLTFSRLSQHIFYHCGGLEDPELDGAGRMLLLFRSVSQAQNSLKVLSNYTQHSSFYEKLMKTVDELKANQVSTDALFSLDEETAQREKIQDIGLICRFYDCFTQGILENQRENLAKSLDLPLEMLPEQQIAFDPRDRLTRMAEKLKHSSWGEGKTFWVDGFTDFTPQQLDVLQHLLAQGEEMTVALTGDLQMTEAVDSLFAPTYQTIRQLKYLADKVGKNIGKTVEFHIKEIENSDFSLRSPALAKMESSLFLDKVDSSDLDPNGEIILYSALTPRSEVEWVAGEILRLVADEGHRFADFSIVSRDFSAYRGLITSIFEKNGIPVFATEMSSILEKPVISVVYNLCQVVNRGYRYEDMFHYLKTGFSTLKLEEVDILENYALLWNINGNSWKREFSKHPQRYDGAMDEKSKKQLLYLNQLREKAMKPFEKLEATIKKASGKGLCEGIYVFLSDIYLYAGICDRQDALLEEGNRAQSEEYQQLWEILCDGLEQSYRLLPDHPMDFEEFSKLLLLVLSQYSVGTIPSSLDQVTAGETTRMKSQRGKFLFWLGAEDSVVPKATNSGGLLTDLDRIALENLDISMNQPEEKLLYREITTAYEICALPTETLYLSYANKKGGETARSCFLMKKLQRLFPKLNMITEESSGCTFRLASPASALEQVDQFPFVRKILSEDGILEIWREKILKLEGMKDWKRGNLSAEMVERLYGKEITLSASRLVKLQACPFAHFMQYGLQAKSRKVAEFSAAEYGTFVHFVLEQVLEGRKGLSGEISDLEQADILGKVDVAVDQYFQDYLKGEKSKREEYLLDRQRIGMKTIVKEALDELSSSEFAYFGGETKFRQSLSELCGKTLDGAALDLYFTGSIDRVDGYFKDNVLYLRLIDYKTGKKSFDYNDLFYGRDLQLMIYAFAVSGMGQENYGKYSKNETATEVVIPALSYFPAKEIVVSGDHRMSESSKKSLKKSELKRNGLYLEQFELLTAIERLKEKEFRFLPVGLKDGLPVGETVLRPEEMNLLFDHGRKILEEIPGKLTSGNVEPEPFFVKEDKTGCSYCEFTAACHFSVGQNDQKYRVEIDKKKDEILQNLSEIACAEGRLAVDDLPIKPPRKRTARIVEKEES